MHVRSKTKALVKLLPGDGNIKQEFDQYLKSADKMPSNQSRVGGLALAGSGISEKNGQACGLRTPL
jgi:hypothetical protein